jgi:hypothetical protein
MNFAGLEAYFPGFISSKVYSSPFFSVINTSAPVSGTEPTESKGSALEIFIV